LKNVLLKKFKKNGKKVIDFFLDEKGNKVNHTSYYGEELSKWIFDIYKKTNNNESSKFIFWYEMEDINKYITVIGNSVYSAEIEDNIPEEERIELLELEEVQNVSEYGKQVFLDKVNLIFSSSFVFEGFNPRVNIESNKDYIELSGEILKSSKVELFREIELEDGQIECSAPGNLIFKSNLFGIVSKNIPLSYLKLIIDSVEKNIEQEIEPDFYLLNSTSEREEKVVLNMYLAQGTGSGEFIQYEIDIQKNELKEVDFNFFNWKVAQEQNIKENKLNSNP
jgi:hypothetical protein